MRHESVRFFADRYLLDGDIYLPNDLQPGETRPAIVACSGYQGLKTIHPERFARSLVPHGYICLAFDYRGFGASEGERGRLAPQDWVEDVRAAVSMLHARAEVDTDRIALLGWALGGGVAVAAGADDDRVAAVATCNAVADGARAARFMHDETSFDALIAAVAADRAQRAAAGRSRIVHPFDIVRLDRITAGYVDAELTKAAGFGSGVTLESADLLLRFRPEDVVHRLAPRPLLLVHGERNELHHPDESRSLLELAGGNARLVLFEDAGHTEWMFDDHPTYQRLVGELVAFYGRALGAVTVGADH